MEVRLKRPFHTLNVSSASAKIYMPNHMVNRYSNFTVSTVANHEFDCLQALVDIQAKSSIVITVSINSSKIHFEEMKQDKIVNNEWRNPIQMSGEYKQYRKGFMEILEPFQTI